MFVSGGGGREAVVYGGINVSLGTILGASDVSDNMVGCADKGIYETAGRIHIVHY